jgi:hypothetical protein
MMETEKDYLEWRGMLFALAVGSKNQKIFS